ncbi:hypothetical protein DUI87_05223 [Hirundo rustica rustica]|uniref:Uncharacterized protein n=1 Tax=Hirundo rustica rustica TaxID=333673 RepID=A0A3M0L3M7_HIRRU|nr:hypothetical protein DUI87_05223 [Hirundo rustica rustica]
MRADTSALLALCEKTDNDIRSCINTLQFLHGRGQRELSVRTVQTMRIGLKDHNKGLFSLWQEIFQLPRPQRHRIGMDPSLPAQLLLGDEDLPHAGGFNSSSQRFHHILHLSISSGEQEKLAQGLFENFLKTRVRDSSLGSVCLALEWLGFSDLLGRAVLQGQSFQLLRYLPFLPAVAKLRQMQNLVLSVVSGMAPGVRSRAGQQALVLEVLCLLLDIIAPKLRPVNTQLYSPKEKQQLAELISTMLTYNLSYLQERLPEGQYVFRLDPADFPPAAPPVPKEESLEAQMGKAVGKSDVWFRFNEGFSNAVRRNLYIRDLL